MNNVSSPCRLYAKISTRLSVPRITMNYAKLNSLMSLPFVDCTNANAANVICSVSLHCDSLNCRNESMGTYLGNFIVDVQPPDTNIFSQ